MSRTNLNQESASLAGVKARLRELREAHRSQLNRAELSERAQRIADTVMAQPTLRDMAASPGCTVAAYVGIGSEPGTQGLLWALHDAGVRVLLPITVRRTEGEQRWLELEWADYDGPASLVEARMGLLEPSGPRLGTQAIAEADLVLAPAMAVSTHGDRLGKGAGCYDRALAHVGPQTPVWAVIYDEELDQPVPHEPHDRRVTAVVTPTRFVSLAGAGDLT